MVPDGGKLFFVHGLDRLVGPPSERTLKTGGCSFESPPLINCGMPQCLARTTMAGMTPRMTPNYCRNPGVEWALVETVTTRGAADDTKTRTRLLVHCIPPRRALPLALTRKEGGGGGCWWCQTFMQNVDGRIVTRKVLPSIDRRTPSFPLDRNS